ncbi:ABC transporter ATP-binding protein [Uliginosibacterium sp. sgz301328]|uniref:ABC transporter ATP-binding protein n=1 Tax=Uliginosibacterium sp. sgz301328 TaxID=3243764 RepID=UPI00359E06C3
MSDVTGTGDEVVIHLNHVGKHYVRGGEIVPVLADIHFDILRGDFLALMGPSGSGKSTLLNLIAGLDQPSSGQVIIDGVDIGELDDTALADWRAANIGFIFQFYNLMPVLSALENVELPLQLTNLPARERRERALTALELVGLGDRVKHYPSELSGGQLQRVAIARAIVSDPTLLVADEPTGDLDRKSGEEVLALMQRLNETLGKTIIMVTHDQKAADAAHAVRHLEKGELSALVINQR